MSAELSHLGQTLSIVKDFFESSDPEEIDSAIDELVKLDEDARRLALYLVKTYMLGQAPAPPAE